MSAPIRSSPPDEEDDFEDGWLDKADDECDPGLDDLASPEEVEAWANSILDDQEDEAPDDDDY